MTRIAIFLVWSMGLLTQTHAHNPARANIEILIEEGLIRMEFAWSLRNALQDQYPFLNEEGRSQEDFLACMEEYVLDHFKIRTGNQLVPISFEYSVPGSHSHSYLFLFKMSKTPLISTGIEVWCDLMTEVYRKQQNTIIFHCGTDVTQCIMDREHSFCFFT